MHNACKFDKASEPFKATGTMWSISCSGGSKQPQPAHKYCWLNATVFRVFAGKGNLCGFATTDAAAASKFVVVNCVDFFAARSAAPARGRARASRPHPVRASASISNATSLSIDQGVIQQCEDAPQQPTGPARRQKLENRGLEELASCKTLAFQNSQEPVGCQTIARSHIGQRQTT